MITPIIHFVSGTLLVLSAWILHGIPNAAWPVMGAAGITFYVASMQSYTSTRRQRPDEARAAVEENA